MKYQVSALDLHFLCSELSEKLKSVKADKIFQPNSNEFLIAMHLSGEGKKLLRIKLPSFIFLTDFKGEMPEEPLDFCMILRKYISGKKLTGIKQVGFERIIELSFESKEEVFKLIVELFSPGNLVLVDKDHKIISVLHAKKFKDRTLRGNVEYEFPIGKNNPIGMTEQEFISIITTSEKESVVKTLALDLSLGGIYAEELCIRAGIPKDKLKATAEEAETIYQSFKLLITEKPEPNALYKDGKPFAVLPFVFLSMPGFEKKSFESFNDALESILTISVLEDEEEKSQQPHKKEIEKLKKQLEQQREQIEEFERRGEDCQRKGEILYENYAIVDDILANINKAREKYSFKEIKEKLKGHKVVKDINEKDKTVIVEL
jgi:predicted ribosome quality control (RQC) complex YloA/Tae2 family protein